MNALTNVDRGLMLQSLLDKTGVSGLLEVEGITEIWVNRPNEAFIETYSGREYREMPELTLERCNQIALAFAVFNNTKVNRANTIVNGVFPKGERAQIVVPPAVEAETVSITIRKPSKVRLSISNYVETGKFDNYQDLSLSIQNKKEQAQLTEITIDEFGVPSNIFLQPFEMEMLKAKKEKNIARLLDLAVQNELNIVFVGKTGSGKTTITKAVCDLVPADTRIITIEDTAELDLPLHKNKVHLFYGDHASPKDLIKSCMRMKPDRIFLTELRGDETWDYLGLLNTGHSGSITTVHANSAYAAYARVASLIKQSEIGKLLDYDYIMREVKMTLDVVIMFKKHALSEIYYNPVEKYRLMNGEDL